MALHTQDTTRQSATELRAGSSAASPSTRDLVDLESILHFNSSSSPPTTVLEPHTALDLENIADSQAPLFNDDPSIFGDYNPLFYQEDVFGRTAPRANIAVNDDMKWLLLGMSARLNGLEAAIAGGNARIVHLDTRVAALTDSLLKAEEFKHAMENLTQSLKDFVIALVTRVFGNQASDVEMNGQV